MIKSSTQSRTATVSVLTCLRHKHLSASETLKPIDIMCLEKVFVEETASLGDTRNAFNEQAWLAGSCAWVHRARGVGPERRHTYPYFAVHGCGEKRRLYIARLENEGVAGGISEQHSHCGRLSDGRESVIVVNASLHKLPSNDNSSLELPGFKLADLNRAPSMLNFKDPVSRNRLLTWMLSV